MCHSLMTKNLHLSTLILQSHLVIVDYSVSKLSPGYSILHRLLIKRNIMKNLSSPNNFIANNKLYAKMTHTAQNTREPAVATCCFSSEYYVHTVHSTSVNFVAYESKENSQLNSQLNNSQSTTTSRFGKY